MLCLMGSKTFVRLTWLCNRQTAVSHSSTEAEVIALDAGVRLEGLPALAFCEEVQDVMSSNKLPMAPWVSRRQLCNAQAVACSSHAGFGEESQRARIIGVLSAVDYVPLPLPPSSGLAKLFVLEDNEAVIEMCCMEIQPDEARCPHTTHRH